PFDEGEEPAFVAGDQVLPGPPVALADLLDEQAVALRRHGFSQLSRIARARSDGRLACRFACHDRRAARRYGPLQSALARPALHRTSHSPAPIAPTQSSRSTR